MPSRLLLLLRAVTAAAWVFLVVAVVPFGPSFSDDLQRFAVLVAAVGSAAVLVNRAARPIDEVFRAGKALGRAEALRELADTRVVQLAERRPRPVSLVREAARD